MSTSHPLQTRERKRLISLSQQPLSSQLLRSLVPNDLSADEDLWSEKNSERFLSPEEFLSLIFRPKRHPADKDRIESLPSIRREMRRLRNVLDTDERSVDISQVSVAHLGMLAFLEGYEEALLIAQALHSPIVLGPHWQTCTVQVNSESSSFPRP